MRASLLSLMGCFIIYPITNIYTCQNFQLVEASADAGLACVEHISHPFHYPSILVPCAIAANSETQQEAFIIKDGRCFLCMGVAGDLQGGYQINGPYYFHQGD